MNKHSTLEAPVWYRYRVAEVRFLTDYVLSAEPVDRRENLLSITRKMAEDIAYRETHRPGGYDARTIENWQRAVEDQLAEALKSPGFRHWQSNPLGSVSIIVEDTA